MDRKTMLATSRDPLMKHSSGATSTSSRRIASSRHTSPAACPCATTTAGPWPRSASGSAAVVLWVGGAIQARTFSDEGWESVSTDPLPLRELWVGVSAPVLWLFPQLPWWIETGVLVVYYYVVSCGGATAGTTVWRSGKCSHTL